MPNKCVLLFAVCAVGAGAQTNDSLQQLTSYLNVIGQSQLAERGRAVAQVRTRADAERRKTMVREKILRLIGGLPEKRGPLAVKEFGTLSGDGFRVEKITYESLPGFAVTADIYVPTGSAGPFPAVVLTPGHEPTAKLGQYNYGANLARMGIVSLAYDPLGAGERLQNFDAGTKASKITASSTGEHNQTNVSTMMIGEQISRYFIWDAMRGIDYLASRKDVNAGRIGAFGCSGGGTVTAYLAALDDRVKVAASACYITSFEELLVSRTGVQEAEQSIPHFIEQGLNFGDWVELAAPKPFAIVSTTEDMFPFAGARQTYEEAKRIYGLYGAEDRLQWITGPGGHGALGPITPAILGFLARYLKDGAGGEPTVTQMRLERPADLLCTPTGQLSTSLGGETVYSLNRKRADAVMPAQRVLASSADLARLQTRLSDDIRTLTSVTAKPGLAAPATEVKTSVQRSGYRLETIAMHSEPGIDLAGLIAIPEREGAKPAVLMMDTLATVDSDLDRLAKSGRIVMALEPRLAPAGAESARSLYLGPYILPSLRALVMGKTIVGMRTDDTIRAIDWLGARADVDPRAITVYGKGPLGLVALHAAALDRRIARVVVENTLTAFRMIVDDPLHRNAAEVVIPGVLRKYEIGDLLLAVHPRPVTVINPRDAAGAVVHETEFRKEAAYVFESDKKLKPADRIRLVWREPADPLPIE